MRVQDASKQLYKRGNKFTKNNIEKTMIMRIREINDNPDFKEMTYAQKINLMKSNRPLNFIGTKQEEEEPKIEEEVKKSAIGTILCLSSF